MSLETLDHQSQFEAEAPLETINYEMALLDPADRIARAHDEFDGRMILLTSFGPTSPVLLHTAARVLPDIQVVRIVHGHETEATNRFADEITKNLRLNVHEIKAPYLPVPDEEKTEEFENFQTEIKVKPLQQALKRFNPTAYLSGIMHWQTPERAEMKFVEHKGSVVAANPVLDLNREDVQAYIEQYDLPSNHDYYDPTKGISQKRECKLNTTIYGDKNV